MHKLKELKKIDSILIATNNPGKFKEIKDLSIQYKNDRDREVRNLNEELANLKAMISQNENSYSEVLTKVNNSINNFLSKAN